jgi:hypothetical protein
LAIVFVLLAGVGATRAQAAPPAPLPCQTFTRASAAAPQLVRGWLARSGDDHVIVCGAAGAGADAAPLYAGESGLSRRGTLCSYASHGLIRVGDGAAGRLQRLEGGDAVSMALAAGGCPAPHAAAAAEPYTTTYDLSPAAFVAIMAFWAAAADSVQGFDREFPCCDDDDEGAATPGAGTALATETRRRLREAIEAGRMKAAGVTRIVHISGRLLRRRYALTVPDPDARPPGSTVYVVYLSKWPGRPYRITSITRAAN